MRAVLCALDDLSDGTGQVFPRGGDNNAESVILVRRGDMVYGYVNRCPHFGIPLDYAGRLTLFGDYVLCSHHYAAFRLEDGSCVEGPCQGASLTPVALEIEGRSMYLAAEPPELPPSR